MDESLFFFEDYNTPVNSQSNVNNTHLPNMMISYMFGVALGFMISSVCAYNSNNRHKIETLHDENEQLKEMIVDLEDENCGLEMKSKELEEKNDKLTADSSANERLIDRLKNEICLLTNKMNTMDDEMTRLESDNRAYDAEISHIQSSLLRSRHTSSTSTTPVFRSKRMRDETI
jgi:chromosome segregation ATPase